MFPSYHTFWFPSRYVGHNYYAILIGILRYHITFGSFLRAYEPHDLSCSVFGFITSYKYTIAISVINLFLFNCCFFSLVVLGICEVDVHTAELKSTDIRSTRHKADSRQTLTLANDNPSVTLFSLAGIGGYNTMVRRITVRVNNKIGKDICLGRFHSTCTRWAGKR